MNQLTRLNRYLMEHQGNKVASSLMKLLSRQLSTEEVERLQSEVSSFEYQIRKRMVKRKIKHLVHFTQAANVSSILENGLLPRQKLEPGKYKYNDSWRRDRRLDASCVSISFPNYLMFYHYKRKTPEAQWAVLLIDPNVMWQMDCAFYDSNASSNRFSTTPIEELKTISAFDALFADYKDDRNEIKRSAFRLPASWSTNPQAEILVFGIIPPEKFSAVCLPPMIYHQEDYRRAWQGIDVRIEDEYFKPRRDFKLWKQGNKSKGQDK